MKATLFCGLICLMGIYATCNKRYDCKQTSYSFEALYKAYPNRDSLKINDTIWLELNTSVQLKDLMSNILVDYSGAANFGTAISILELVRGENDPAPVPSANKFSFVVVQGAALKSIKQDQIREFQFEEKDGAYQFKLGIVPQEKGLFAFGLGNSANVYRKNDKCTKATFNLTFKDTDQHLYLYEQSRPGYAISEYERQHMYCFKVY